MRSGGQVLPQRCSAIPDISPRKKRRKGTLRPLQRWSHPPPFTRADAPMTLPEHVTSAVDSTPLGNCCLLLPGQDSPGVVRASSSGLPLRQEGCQEVGGGTPSECRSLSAAHARHSNEVIRVTSPTTEAFTFCTCYSSDGRRTPAM